MKRITTRTSTGWDHQYGRIFIYRASCTVIIYPPIPLQQGRVVHVRQDKSQHPTDLNDDPVAIAQQLASQGAEWLHLVNRDGAYAAAKFIPIVSTSSSLDPLPANLQVLKAIRQQVNLPIQFCGGARSLESIQQLIELGASRVILGSIVLERPALLCDAIRKWGANRIAISLSARDGIVATSAASTPHGLDMIEVGHRLYAMGVRKVLYTDNGPSAQSSTVNVKAIARLGDSTGLQIIADGVTGLEAIRQLKEQEYYNIEGAVLSPMLSRTAPDVQPLIDLAKAPLVRYSAGIIPYRRSADELQILILYNYALEQWQLPRGHIEVNESIEACAQREFAEQTNLRLQEFATLPTFPLHFVRHFRDYAINRSITFFLGRVQDGEIVLTNENHCEALWASPEEALSLIAETGEEQLPALESALRHLGVAIED